MEVEIELNKLYPWQIQVLKDLEDENLKQVILAVSRRAGKTELCIYKICLELINGKQILYCAPRRDYMKLPFQRICDTLKPIIKRINKTDKTIETITGGILYCLSTRDPDSVRSRGYDLVVVDEHAMQIDETLTEAILPTLTERRGKLLSCSTPKGYLNHWKKLFDSESKQSKSYQLPWSCSPHLTQQMMDEELERMGPFKFRQEFLACFLGAEGSIFNPAYLENVMLEHKDFPKEFKKSIIAIDPANSEDIKADNTSIVFIGHIDGVFYVDCYAARLGLDALLNKIEEIHNYYKPSHGLVFENNGFQKWIGPLVIQRNITNKLFGQHHSTKKKDRIQTLDVHFARRNIKILNSQGGQQMLGELYDFPSPKAHDDCIDALEMGIKALYEV